MLSGLCSTVLRLFATEFNRAISLTGGRRGGAGEGGERGKGGGERGRIAKGKEKGVYRNEELTMLTDL